MDTPASRPGPRARVWQTLRGVLLLCRREQFAVLPAGDACVNVSAAMKQRAGRWRGLYLPLPGHRRQARSPQTRPEGGRSFPAAQCQGSRDPVSSDFTSDQATRLLPAGPSALGLGCDGGHSGFGKRREGP